MLCQRSQLSGDIKYGWDATDDMHAIFEYILEKQQLRLNNLLVKESSNLSESLYGKNHRVYMDNFFPSYNLIKFLKTQNILACGTVNMSWKSLPKNLTHNNLLKRGDFESIMTMHYHIKSSFSTPSGKIWRLSTISQNMRVSEKNLNYKSIQHAH